jgi:tetratricopeptide (TPR) repeat protein
LQHTNIVPLYWVHDEPDKNRRTLCMPYFGNVTLAGLLQGLKHQPLERRQGQDILKHLDAAREQAAVSLSCTGPGRALLARASYTQAICWMGACLADALQYAHERGLIHLDIKPSNILVAGDGQPMLLDFHLAQEPLSPQGPSPRGLGGTFAYVSPEQRAALEALRQAKPVTTSVDGRTDLYSLGLVLYQALGGPVPLPKIPPRLETLNTEVSTGLADIIHHCLADEPAARYPDAAALAADLRRHLADLPLRGVANRSWTERWRKWHRRKPHALTLSALAAILLVAALSVGIWLWSQQHQRLTEAEHALHKGEQLLAQEDWSRAVDTLERGLTLANTSGGTELAERITSQLNKGRERLRQAERGKALDDFHRLVKRLRLHAANEILSATALADLETRCRSLWEARGKILSPGPSPGEAAEQRARRDLLDLATILADLHARSQPGDAARKEAIQILLDAEGLGVGSLLLYRELSRHARAQGDEDLAQTAECRAKHFAPHTVADHVDLGRAFVKEGDYRAAADEFDRALALDPRDFWANFLRGACAYRLQQYHDAVGSFQSCIVLSAEAPETAHCYVNRAIAQSALGNTDAALADYDHALRLDGKLAAAWLYRGLLHLQHKDHAAAITDLDQALSHGADASTTHFHLAQAYLAQRDRHEALAHLRQALAANPEHRGAAELHARLLKSKE